jgi:hypothetical protein
VSVGLPGIPRDAATVQVRLVGTNLPGRQFQDTAHSGCTYDDVMIGIQRGREIEQVAGGDADQVVFEFELRPGRDRDARGPYAQGRPGDRFVYLAWMSGPQR